MNHLKVFVLCTISTLILLIFSGCSDVKKNIVKENSTGKNPISYITSEDASAKLQELSKGLNVQYDDMKELTYCFSNFDSDMSVIVTPYVVLDKNYNPTLIEHLQYFAGNLIQFKTLYIKSANQVNHFDYKNVDIISYESEAYTGVMNTDVYNALKEAIDSGYVRVRLEGKGGIAEKELTAEEMAEIDVVFSIYEYFSSVIVKEKKITPPKKGGAFKYGVNL